MPDAPTPRTHPVADPAVVDAWCREFATTRDPALRTLIAERHLWLVHVCARQLRRRAEPLDDLLQVAQIGLLHAIDRFDPAFGVAFRTFASATILGELRRHYRTTWRVRVPRRLQELHLAVNAATDHLTGMLGRSPRVSEVATFLAITEDDVVEAIAAGRGYWPGSIDAADDDDQSGSRLPADPTDLIGAADDRDEVCAVLNRLPERERRILVLKFYGERTQSEIGQELGLSQVHVSRLMRAALDTLRQEMARST